VTVTELRKGKQPDDFLFTWENGEPIIDFRESWEQLTNLFHDCRRSAVDLPELRLQFLFKTRSWILGALRGCRIVPFAILIPTPKQRRENLREKC